MSTSTSTSLRASSWARVRRRFRSQPLARVAAAVLTLLLVAALGADCLASDLPLLLSYRGEVHVLPNIRRPGVLRGHDNHTLRRDLAATGKGWAVYPLIPFGPNQTQPGGALDLNVGPGTGAHLLGTDDVGRDVAAQLVHGARVALLVGLVAVLLYVLIGVVLGALAGYLRGPVDHLVSWGVAVMLTFPTFLLILVIQGLVSAQSLWGVMLVIGLTGWAGVARLVRGEVLRVGALPFVEAARGLGASHGRILLVHVLPHALGPVAVAATFGMASAILVETGLSFLGFGPDAPSWGRLLAAAQLNRPAWWLTVFPGLAIFVTVLSYNFVAEGLQDALDPRHAVRLPREWRTGGRAPSDRAAHGRAAPEGPRSD
jgi:peptide/nickel transport system permease protein